MGLGNAKLHRMPEEDRLRAERLAAMSRLASIVGHELRNPLSSIKNTLWLVRETLKGVDLPEKDQRLPDFVEFADREIDAAVRIIADLLDFAKTDKLFFEPTNVNGAVQDALRTLNVPSNMQVQSSFDPAVGNIQADAIKIRQAFLRLAINAIEAMPGGGRLEVVTRVERAADGASRIFVSFRDTGIGIADSDRMKLFEPFYTTKQDRVGLGLAIAMAIARAHGGGINVESQLGRGSTFSVYLSMSPQKVG